LKEDVKRFFFRNYVPKASLKAKLKKVVSDATIHKYYKKLNPTEIILGGNLDVFVSIEIAQELTEIINTVAGKGQWGWRTHTFEKYKNQHNYLSLDEVMKKKLNCSMRLLKRLIKEKLLFVSDKYGDRMLFEKEHVFELFSEQARLIEKYSNNYYTAKQIQAKYSNAFCAIYKRRRR
jgi:hypothetical protein